MRMERTYKFRNICRHPPTPKEDDTSNPAASCHGNRLALVQAQTAMI